MLLWSGYPGTATYWLIEMRLFGCTLHSGLVSFPVLPVLGCHKLKCIDNLAILLVLNKKLWRLEASCQICRGNCDEKGHQVVLPSN